MTKQTILKKAMRDMRIDYLKKNRLYAAMEDFDYLRLNNMYYQRAREKMEEMLKEAQMEDLCP